MKARLRLYGILGMVLFISAWVYLPVLNWDYVNWDDDVHVTQNPLVHTFSLSSVARIFTSTVQGTYIPLTTLSFALENALTGGLSPLISHLINLCLHGAVVIAVFALALRLGLSAWAAALAAALFAWHPMHVESVAWVTARKDGLYSFFYILSLIAYKDFLRTKHVRFWRAAVIGGILSMLAKPMALSLPLIWLWLDYDHSGRITHRDMLMKVGPASVIAGLGMVTYVHFARVPGGGLAQMSVVWLWTAAFYLWKFFVPLYFIPLYQLPAGLSWTHPAAWMAAGTLALCGAAAVGNRQARWLRFALGYYFLSLFFLFRFDVQADISIVADRFMYLPSLGFCLAAGAGWDALNRQPALRVSLRRWACGVAVVAALWVLAVKSRHQTFVWRNSDTLWQTVLSYYPHQTIAYNNRGFEAFQRGDYDQALQDFEAALRMNPRNREAWNNIGIIYSRQGRWRQALSHYNRAIRLFPRHAPLYNNRGNLYRTLERWDEALADYSRAIELKPGYIEALINRANTLCVLNRFDEAENDYRQVLQRDEKNFFAFFGLGMVALAGRGQAAEALTWIDRALAVNPYYPNAYYYRAQAYSFLGDQARAQADFAKARQLGFEGDSAVFQSLSFR